MNSTEEKVLTPVSTKGLMDEDWAVVILGFMIIMLFLSGVNIPAPTYKWTSVQDLGETIFSSGNLLRIASQFVLVFIFSAIASWITNKSLKSAIKVFPVLYAISVIALILEGNAGFHPALRRKATNYRSFLA